MDGYTGTTEVDCTDEQDNAAKLTVITSVMDCPLTMIMVSAIDDTMVLSLNREQLEKLHVAILGARHYWDN